MPTKPGAAAQTTDTKGQPGLALRSVALRYPEAEEGVACQGTAIECITVKARNKAFLFVGHTDARVKLSGSLAEATDHAAKEPGCYKVGVHGWVTISFGDGGSLPLEMLEKWVDESYRLLAPSQLVALLPQRDPPVGEAAGTAKKKRAKKKPPVA